MISIWADFLEEYRGKEVHLPLRFHRWDNGEVYTQIHLENAGYTVPGVLHISKNNGAVDIARISANKGQVYVVVNWRRESSDGNGKQSSAKGQWKARGFVRQDGNWQEMPVQVVPLREDLFSRTKGLFETDILSDVCVFEPGLGSVGSFVGEELAKAGIRNHILLDFDRVEVANVVRHNAAGLSDVGRYKTRVVADRIYNKNPYARVETYEEKITWRNQDFVRSLVRKSDIVIGSVDNREPRLVLNKLCIEENKPLILMGAFHRAFGVQILFMRRPRIDPCYVDFLRSRPMNAKNLWPSNLEQGQQVAYADRPVQNPDPGLSVDIAPMSVMTVRLCLNHLLQGKSTALEPPDENFIAPLYRYLNRREPGINVPKGMNILSWYSIDLKRNPICPVCGDGYVNEMSKAHGISVSPEDIKRCGQKAARQQNV